MIKINVTGLNAYAPMPQMLRERAEAIRERNRRLGRRPQSKCYATDFPVTGGWGYTQEDACVFDFGDEYAGFPPKTRRSMMESDSISLQNLFIERRVYEEIIHSPLPGTIDLCSLRIKNVCQVLVQGENGRTYDRIDFQVRGFLQRDLDWLEANYEECRANNDIEGIERNIAMANERTHFYDSVCWFDISCYWNI